MTNCNIPIIFQGTFVLSDTPKCITFYLIPSLPQPWNQTFLQKALVHFRRDGYLKINIWAQGLFIVTISKEREKKTSSQDLLWSHIWKQWVGKRSLGCISLLDTEHFVSLMMFSVQMLTFIWALTWWENFWCMCTHLICLPSAFY